ncbi:uncharacterized protein Boh2 [Drosophila bipectinata]|uniref:uncharacterized protein Boh2 n=1 Tax=Drosophila bipectinata TaxID=42026 RepID=UPI001C8911B5|nr:uncharacterized protein LOC108132340 [Drosophila bipectinata]
MQQSNSVPPGGDNLLPLKACSTAGCKVANVVDKAKRKCSQFVTAPYIMSKPLVVNGHTSIFQVSGEMAKMGDIPDLSGGVPGELPIYRIKPGTHAHVINYVLVDEGSDSLEKAKSGDQEAMRLLLESQRESAIAKLQKLIGSHRGANSTGTSTGPITTRPGSSTGVGTSAQAQASLVPTSSNVTTPQIHPDFSIASVEGAVNFGSGMSTAAPPPLLSIPATAAVSTGTGNALSATEVDRLQAEIMELRRTVASLKEGGR